MTLNDCGGSGARDPIGECIECKHRGIDGYGNVQHGEPSYSVSSDGRVVQVDQYKNEQPQKAQYVVKGARVYETDPYGRIRYHRPSYSVGKDGKVVQTDAYGNKRYDKPQLLVRGGKVYETDAYGRMQQKFEVKTQKK